jgi:hypothetical protein
VHCTLYIIFVHKHNNLFQLWSEISRWLFLRTFANDTALELYADYIVSAAARRVISLDWVVGGGAPTSWDRRRRRREKYIYIYIYDMIYHIIYICTRRRRSATPVHVLQSDVSTPQYAAWRAGGDQLFPLTDHNLLQETKFTFMKQCF